MHIYTSVHMYINVPAILIINVFSFGHRQLLLRLSLFLLFFLALVVVVVFIVVIIDLFNTILLNSQFFSNHFKATTI